MKRFVLLSDLHAHPWSAFSIGDGLQNSRLRRALNILEASLERAQRENIPWVFAGDLVHTAGYALNTVMAGVMQVLSQWPEVDKIMIWGNHDARGIGGKITIEQTCLAAVALSIDNLVILDPTIPPHLGTCERGNVTFAGASYQPRAELLEFAPEADVGIYHQTVRGSRAPNGFLFEEGIDPAELLKRYRLSIVGHIHHPQQIDAPTGQGILIPGSPEHHNFGDEGDHGWWVVTLDEGMGKPRSVHNPELEFISGGSPKFLTVDTPAGVEDDDNFYRVRTVPPGEHVPDGAMVVAPSPTTVKVRDALHGISETDQILEVWLKTKASPKGTHDTYLAAGRELLVAQDPMRLRDAVVSHLSLQNFCCFADQQIVLQPGLWLITGKGKDYPSNGAGKSSLIGEALYWLLFGRTTKGLGAEEVIRWGEQECTVKAVIDEDGGITTSPDDGKAQGSTLIITRQRGPLGHTLSILQDGYHWEATSVNEMTAKLGRYLGITPEIFQNLAYFSQEKLLLFSSATDGERKNVLADLIGLSGYQAASSMAAEQVLKHRTIEGQEKVKEETLLAQIKEQQEVVHDSDGRMHEWAENQKHLILDAVNRLTHLKQQDAAQQQSNQTRLHTIDVAAQSCITHYRNQREKERTDREEQVRQDLAVEHAGRITTVEEQLEAQKKKATQGFSSLKAAHKTVAKLPELQASLDLQTRAVDGLRDDRTNMKVLQAKACTAYEQSMHTKSLATSALVRAEKSFAAGTCPTCKQAITPEHVSTCLASYKTDVEEATLQECEYDDAVTVANTNVEVAEQEVATAHSRAEQLQSVARQLEERKDLLSSVTVLEQELKAVREAVSPESAVQEHVSHQIEHLVNVFTAKQQGRVDRARYAISRRQLELTRELQTTETQMTQLREQANPHVAAKEQAITRMSGISLQREKATEQAARATVAIEMYDYWCKGFSRQGIQSLLVEEIAVLFNNNRGNIFPLLTQGVYDVQFSTLSTTRKGELREKTDFYIYEHGKAIPYGTLSGGQRRRVDIGIMLVLTQAVAKWMGTQGILGLLILDEVFGFLDASGAEGLLAALGQVNEQVPTIYVMTHDTALQSLIPNVIHVVQNADGISEVVL